MKPKECIGRYEIQRLLGSGAAGVVYLARDPLIDRDVAIKVVRRDPEASSEISHQRFLHEARAAGRLSHANIVTIFDVAEDHENGEDFITMEYVEGDTLKHLLSHSTRFNVQEAAELTATLASALDHAHHHGVVHRDIKPANIILTTEGTVKVADFGIAHLDTSNLTAEGSLVGTPNYMAPELIKGKSADGRSDLYSLGVVFYELVTGLRPFAGKTIPQLLNNIATKTMPDPCQLSPGLPEPLSAIMERCLTKNPEDRFQSGRELADALNDLDLPAKYFQVETSENDRTSTPIDESDLLEVAASPTRVTDLLATQARETAQFTDETAYKTLLRRWSAVAQQILRARLFWPAVVCLALLVMIVVGSQLTTRKSETVSPAETLDASAETHDLAANKNNNNNKEEEPLQITEEVTATEIPSVPLDSTLVVQHKNRLSLAYISLWIDGERMWSQELAAKKGVFKRFGRFSGELIEHSIAVSEGKHTIEVHISGKSMKIEARASIKGTFRSNESRQLKVGLNPYTDKLKLAWID